MFTLYTLYLDALSLEVQELKEQIVSKSHQVCWNMCICAHMYPQI